MKGCNTFLLLRFSIIKTAKRNVKMHCKISRVNEAFNLELFVAGFVII
jgi:hypothetical protein